MIISRDVIDISEMGILNFKMLSRNFNTYYVCDYHSTDVDYNCAIRRAFIIRKFLLNQKTKSITSSSSSLKSYDTVDTVTRVADYLNFFKNCEDEI